MTAINAYTYNNSKWFSPASHSITPTTSNNGTSTSQSKSTQKSSNSPVDTVTISDAARSYYDRGKDTTSSHIYYRESFANYDNSAAKTERIAKLMDDYHNGTGSFVFDKYGLTQETMKAFIKPENRVGTMDGQYFTRGEMNIAKKNGMEDWYDGSGTFQWSYVNVRNEDGYIAIANTVKAQAAKSIWDNIDWNNSESKLNAHLSTTSLTPKDFSYIDGTRLFGLQDGERADFLNIVDGLLSEAGIDVKASQLEYGFNADGRYDLSSIGLEPSDTQKQIQDVVYAAISRAINTGVTRLYSYAYKVYARGVC